MIGHIHTLIVSHSTSYRRRYTFHMEILFSTNTVRLQMHFPIATIIVFGLTAGALSAALIWSTAAATPLSWDSIRESTQPRRANLTSKPWIGRLKDPCRHYRPLPRACGGDVPDVIGDLAADTNTTTELLSIAGRESLIKSIFTVIGNRVAHAVQPPIFYERTPADMDVCRHMHDDLPHFSQFLRKNVSTDGQGLKQYYQTFLALSAHFHVAAEDWTEGLVCESHEHSEHFIDVLTGLRDRMADAMCALMYHDPTGKEDGPKPTTDMNRDLFLPVVTDFEMTHFYGCAERILRDCFLYRTVMTAVRRFTESLDHIDHIEPFDPEYFDYLADYFA